MAEYVSGVMAAEETEAIKRHLKSCRSCAATERSVRFFCWQAEHGNPLGVVRIKLANDEKRQGELVGRVAGGEEKGKIVFLNPQPEGHAAGDVVNVIVTLRSKKFLRATNLQA
jgi:hypothetical protein